MLRNYLQVAIRNLRKNKWFSLINVIGLTIGITSSLIIFIYINQELSYDKFHNDAERVYRVIKSTVSATGKSDEGSVPFPMIGALKNDFTHFEATTQIYSDDRPLAVVGDEKHIIDHSLFADSSFFDVFSFKIISGNPKKSLSEPNYAFLSQSLAKELFDDSNPIGEKILLRNKLEVEVAGIIEDTPSNSHLQFDMLVSYPSFAAEYTGFDMFNINSWEMTADTHAYVKLKEEVSEAEVEEQFKNIVTKYYKGEDQITRSFHLQPLLDIHFNQKLGTPSSVNSSSLWALGVIGLFILLIACVNFINLSTALAVKRTKEVGVRKTLGSGRFQLIKQYMIDTFIVTVLSALLAVGISERLILVFNKHFEKDLQLNLFQNVEILGFILLVIIIVTLLSGLYPAIVLSGYSPIKALKTTIHSQDKNSLFMRKGLIVVQFFISQVLIISTIVIANQMEYFNSKPLGFEKEAIINIDIPKNDDVTLERLRNRLSASPEIKCVSFALGPPISNDTFSTHYYLTDKGNENEYTVQIKPVDYYYLKTYNLKLKYGRWFTPGEEKGSREIFTGNKPAISYVVNETAVRRLGFSNPEEAIGANITSGINSATGPIIGIVEDYHLGSFHEEIMPAIMVHMPMFYYDAGIKISTANLQSAISHIETVHNDLFSETIFDFEFLDDSLRDFYVEEQRMYFLFKIFSGLSIFISSLGLLGMISFMVNQKAKEIGVRKVLGAGTYSIVKLFSKEFMVLVFIAFVISAPVAWYTMDMWLADFAYRIEFKLWFLVIAILISAAITFATIGYQSVKAAVSNPVDALRSE